MFIDEKQLEQPPRLLDEYSDPFDLKKEIADSTQLSPPPISEDDYSVPYEVKMQLKGTLEM